MIPLEDRSPIITPNPYGRTDGFASLASSETDATVTALQDLVSVAGYEAFAAAQRYGLASLSDLVGAAPAAAPSPAPGERPMVDEPLVLLGDDAPRVGDIGPEVRQLQELLVAAGYPPGPINGIYEEPTRRAVAAFQADAGVAPPPDPAPNRPAPDGAVIHLTFDDGPNSTYTPQILDLLARYDARAVLFAIGQQIGGGGTVVDRLVADGHRMGNHSWSHPSLAELSRPAFDQEIGRTQDAIAAATGAPANCLRPPYGAMGSETRTWAAAAGLEIVLWDSDPQDWARPGVDAVVGSVVDYARPGDVVLFHDGGGNREQTVAALEQILAQLSVRGFSFTAAPGC